MPEETAITSSALVDSLGAWLQYGLLGFSALLVFLGFLLFLKTVSAETVNEQRYRASRFFLVFSLVFLLAAAGVKLADDAMNPHANIYVDIQPWNPDQIERVGLDGTFFIKHVSEKEPTAYEGNPLEKNVASGSVIQCGVYPLFDKVEQLTLQLARTAVTASGEPLSNDLGIEPLGPRNE